MKTWVKIKQFFTKRVKRRITFLNHDVTIRGKKVSKRLENVLDIFYLNLTGRVNGGPSFPGDLLIQYRKPHTKCLKVE